MVQQKNKFAHVEKRQKNGTTSNTMWIAWSRYVLSVMKIYLNILSESPGHEKIATGAPDGPRVEPDAKATFRTVRRTLAAARRLNLKGRGSESA